jgi:uncharacterized protein YggE
MPINQGNIRYAHSEEPMKQPVFSICFLTLALCAPAVGLAEQIDSTGIHVTGECLKKIAQDRAAVSIGTSTQAPTAQQAADETIKAHEKMKAEVTRLGLKDLLASTESYTVNQDCSYDGTKQVCSGFRARLSTRFETSEIAKIGEVIAVASKHSSQEVSQLQTFVSPELLKTERESCLEVATKNATSKAQKLAAGAGVRLGKLVALHEGASGTEPVQILRQQRAFVAAEASSIAESTPSIDSKPQELNVLVQATYAIE